MPKIAYEMTEGMAHNLRFEINDYIPKPNESLLEGDKIPDINTLHSAEYLSEQTAQIVKERKIQTEMRKLAEDSLIAKGKL